MTMNTLLCTNNMKVILIATLSLVVLGCSTDQLDCYVADSIKLLDSTQENEVTYSLVLRITGLSDKVTFVELYQGVLSFDACENYYMDTHSNRLFLLVGVHEVCGGFATKNFPQIAVYMSKL